MRPRAAALIALLTGTIGCATASPAFELLGFPEPTTTTSGAVLFGFDAVAFPEVEGGEKRLVTGTPRGIVVQPGPPDSHDERIFFYGTVVRVAENDFRMWYAGVHDPDYFGRHTRKLSEPRRDAKKEAGLRFAYATSKDGVTWTKPALGLVEFAGSRANNIVDLPVAPRDLVEPAVVLHDPTDPDPSRRFKLLFEHMDHSWGAAASPDGLRWKVLGHWPPNFEMAGVTRHRGRYYVTGQGNFPQPEPVYRRLGVYASNDFVDWKFAGVGLDRSPKERRPDYHWFRHPQVHLGAGLWNRGNVILAVYGQWHGVPDGQELHRDNFIGDLGLALSHDATHFIEPVPGVALVAEKNEQPPTLPFPYARALQQGQAMYNVGDQTLCLFGYWSGPDIRLASWERDRFGYLAPAGGDARATSSPVRVRAGRVKVYVNAQIAPGATLTATVLRQDGTAVPGFDRATIAGNHLRQQIVWPGGDALTPELGPARIQLAGTGDWKLHALYLGDGE